MPNLRLLRFRNKDVYNLFLLSPGPYGKRVKNTYSVRLRRARYHGRRSKRVYYRYLPATVPTRGHRSRATRYAQGWIGSVAGSYRSPRTKQAARRPLASRASVAYKKRVAAYIFATRPHNNVKNIPFSVLGKYFLRRVSSLIARRRFYAEHYRYRARVRRVPVQLCSTRGIGKLSILRYSLRSHPAVLNGRTAHRWYLRHLNSCASFTLTAPVKSFPRRVLSGHSFRGNSYAQPSSLYLRRRGLQYAVTSIAPSNSKSFILHYVGLLLLSKLNFRVRIGARMISTLRRKLYSFVKPNEFRFRAFSSRRRLTVVKLIRGLGKFGVLGRKHLSKTYLHSFFTNAARRFNRKDSYSSVNSPIFRIPRPTKNDVYYKEKFFSFSSSAEESAHTPKRDLSIERIRFKPGYQRLWRRFRLALAESIGRRYVYQTQLTRYLGGYARKSKQRCYYTRESTLRNVMLYSRLIPDLALLQTLFSNKIIFVNHRLLSTCQMFVYKNDFVQLEITTWFYIFSKWMLLWTRARNNKFKRLVYKKSLSGKYKVMKQRKQRSRYTPKWIFLVDFDFIDVKPFLEVDYLTLSFFIVYDFRFFSFYKPERFTEEKYNLYRLYNWKYIN